MGIRDEGKEHQLGAHPLSLLSLSLLQLLKHLLS